MPIPGTWSRAMSPLGDVNNGGHYELVGEVDVLPVVAGGDLLVVATTARMRMLRLGLGR